MNTKEQSLFEANGINGQNPSLFDHLRAKSGYCTDNVNVYAKAISQMNLGDLQTHAMDRGIKPASDRRRLEAILINEFKTVIGRKKANAMSRKISGEQLKQQEAQRQKSMERNGFLRTLV